MAKRWVNHHKHHKDTPFCMRYLDYLLNLDIIKYGSGYTQGIEDDKGYLHCLIVGELIENMWIQQVDANVICLLTNRPYNTEYPKILVDRFAKWAQARDCTNLYMFSWSPRPVYKKLFTKLGLEKSGYTYTRKLK